VQEKKKQDFYDFSGEAVSEGKHYRFMAAENEWEV